MVGEYFLKGKGRKVASAQEMDLSKILLQQI
ncbi:hypothetical protein HNR36_001224 [Ureibacillus thermosphaericus]|uniref:Uncharacterized protein n=1 Tax=Ureibacillus thermosphaericus TaxID=51173 RepID=A0A840PXB3_URETH|nr:hypothetical protein [Ureibacillus thermosphaericus]